MSANSKDTWSLRKHLTDIVLDRYILGSDVICFTETQICQGDNVEEINQVMSNTMHGRFDMEYHNNEEDKYSSLAFAYKDGDILLHQIKYLNRVMVVKISKPQMLTRSGEFFCCTIVIIYRKNNMEQSYFWSYVSDIVEMFKPDLLVGDFNANYFDESITEKVAATVPNYAVVTGDKDALYHAGGTQIDGGMLDYVLLRRQFPHQKSLLF